MELKNANEKPSQQKFLTWIIIVFAITLLLVAGLSYYLVFLYPENQVSQLGITNVTEKANFINQYRTTSIQLISTLAQILGGGVVLVGIYFAWKNFGLAQATLKSDQEKSQKDLEVAQATLKHNQEVSQKNLEVALSTLESNMKNAQDNLKLAQEGQTTDRFTRAVDQLGAKDKDGKPVFEVRLGAIYALEGIANEPPHKYYSQIIEILTAYVKMNSRFREENVNIDYIHDFEKFVNSKTKVNPDIKAIMDVIKRRKFYLEEGESGGLELRETYLRQINLKNAHLEGAFLLHTDLIGAYVEDAHLEGAYLNDAYLNWAYLNNVNLEDAHLESAHLEKTVFKNVNLKKAHFKSTFLGGAYLVGANLRGAENLTAEQLSKVSTLYQAQLDQKLEDELRAIGFGFLLDNKPRW